MTPTPQSIDTDDPAVSMNILFNSSQYYVAEISGPPGAAHGFEVVNKLTGHGAFIDGAVAAGLRQSFHSLVVQNGGQVTIEQVEEFIGGYDALLTQRVVYH